jgi:hypothetical protein
MRKIAAAVALARCLVAFEPAAVESVCLANYRRGLINPIDPDQQHEGGVSWGHVSRWPIELTR